MPLISLIRDFQLIANLEYLLGMLESAPTSQEMKQSVCAAKIDKCAEISYVLNNTFYDITFFDLLKRVPAAAQPSWLRSAV